MRKAIILLFIGMAVTYTLLLIMSAENYKQSKRKDHLIDSLKKVIHEKN